MGANRLPRGLLIQEGEIANSPADNDGVRVEDIDDRGDCFGESGPQALEGRPRGALSSFGPPGDLGKRRLGCGSHRVVALKRGTRNHGLDTPSPPAVTRGLLASDRIVAPLPGDPVEAVENLPINHDPAPAARAEDNPEHHPAPSCRAERGLRQRKAVGVVRHPDRGAKRDRKVGP